ncbi:MAG: HAMP domain-containing sensor histidine kinase [Gordonia sp. (in: high G+C Gram-positive bacteria)]|uniref:HAMP domain-containing sensor histidine kinase n=1 Tax=Gordonia sp. (in: high G+C Gram-positive bacteria) TaxID=84139 RepID=UPI003BB6D5FF
MRQRILRTMIAVLLAMGILLGVPLAVGTWVWIAQSARDDLSERLKTMSEYVLAEEAGGRVAGPHALELEEFALLVPAGATLTLSEPAEERRLGPEPAVRRISESVTLGAGYTLTLSVPAAQVRPTQWLAVTVLIAVVVGSVAAGAVVALVTARRLTEPLTQVAERSAAMARGDLSSPWPYQGIDELDRVTAALSEANSEIARRLEREGQILGDVSHQLRSRLTAIGLRLDELALHDDPAVVAEAQAGVAQVERLSAELDELVSASRADTGDRAEIDVAGLVGALAHDFAGPFAAVGRVLRVSVAGEIRPVRGRPGRLREALSALLDNALRHGAETVDVQVEDMGSADVVRCTVSDEGGGIPDLLAPDIFRRGFSGGESTGVGLSLARALVEADGGRLDLVSRRPAVFSIVVPVAADDSDSNGDGDCDGDGDRAARLKPGQVPHR